MWYASKAAVPDWSAAIKYLSKVDPVLKPIIKAVGPCTLAPRRDYFPVLCLSIFNQQISMAAATALFEKFRYQFPRRLPTPAHTLKFLEGGDEELIRSVGISRQKKAYLIDLSKHYLDGRIKSARLIKLDDDGVVEALSAVHGIGRWTAEMFLIFVMNRPDVFPIDDLGVQESYKIIYGLKERPTPKVLEPLGDKWRPWRTIATWYLWKGRRFAMREEAKSATKR